MPRPVLPTKFVPDPLVDLFPLDGLTKKRMAEITKVQALTPEYIEMIEWTVSCYLATRLGSISTTIANVLRLLRQLEGSRRAQREAIEVLANAQSGVDSETHGLLYPLAKSVLAGDVSAKHLLLQIAEGQAAAIAAHPRVQTSSEPMRHFCGVLRVIFNECTRHPGWVGVGQDEAWRRCGQFALQIFAAAGIDHADFDAHPERLKEYLGTEV
jgi:hypothetical protein